MDQEKTKQPIHKRKIQLTINLRKEVNLPINSNEEWILKQDSGVFFIFKLNTQVENLSSLGYYWWDINWCSP